MTPTPFMVKLTEAERATLESERARLGLRSMAEVIRHWIGNAPKRGDLQRMLDEGATLINPTKLFEPVKLTNAKGEPKELPKPIARKGKVLGYDPQTGEPVVNWEKTEKSKSRLKGVWKAP